METTCLTETDIAVLGNLNGGEINQLSFALSIFAIMASGGTPTDRDMVLSRPVESSQLRAFLEKKNRDAYASGDAAAYLWKLSREIAKVYANVRSLQTGIPLSDEFAVLSKNPNEIPPPDGLSVEMWPSSLKVHDVLSELGVGKYKPRDKKSLAEEIIKSAQLLCDSLSAYDANVGDGEYIGHAKRLVLERLASYMKHQEYVLTWIDRADQRVADNVTNRLIHREIAIPGPSSPIVDDGMEKLEIELIAQGLPVHEIDKRLAEHVKTWGMANRPELYRDKKGDESSHSQT